MYCSTYLRSLATNNTNKLKWHMKISELTDHSLLWLLISTEAMLDWIGPGPGPGPVSK